MAQSPSDAYQEATTACLESIGQTLQEMVRQRSSGPGERNYERAGSGPNNMYMLTDENLKRIDLWFQCYVDMADGKRWSDRDRICYMSSAIKSEEVLDWFQNLRRKHRESFPRVEWTFEQWRKELIEVFGFIPTEEAAFMKIDKRKWHEGEKAEVYFRDMLRVCREADRDMSEKEKVRRIKVGMLPNKEMVLFIMGAKAFLTVRDFLAEVEIHESVQDLIENSKNQEVGRDFGNQDQQTYPEWRKNAQSELAVEWYPCKPNVTAEPFKSYMSDGEGGLVAADVGSTPSNSVNAISVPVNAGMVDSRNLSINQAARQSSGPRLGKKGLQLRRVSNFDKDKWKLEDGTLICRNCNGIDHTCVDCPRPKRTRFELLREPTTEILLEAKALAELRPVQAQLFFTDIDRLDSFWHDEPAEYFDLNDSQMEASCALIEEVEEENIQPGFVSSDCTSTFRSLIEIQGGPRVRQCLRAVIPINGITKSVIIDTGAATSIVPLSVAREVGADVRDFLPHWPDTTLTSVHNVHKKVDRTYTQLSVTMDGITHKVPCFVKEEGIDKIILGTDYLEAVCAEISFRRGTITISGTKAVASQVSSVDQTTSSLIGGSNPRPIPLAERFAVSGVMARRSDPVQGQIGGSIPRPASRKASFPTRLTSGSQGSLDTFLDTQVQTVAYDTDPDPRVQGFFQRVSLGRGLLKGLFPGNLLTTEWTDSRVEAMFAVLNQGREYHDQIVRMIVDSVGERGESSQGRLDLPTLKVRLDDTVVTRDTGLEHLVFPDKRFRRNEPDDSEKDLA